MSKHPRYDKHSYSKTTNYRNPIFQLPTAFFMHFLQIQFCFYIHTLEYMHTHTEGSQRTKQEKEVNVAGESKSCIRWTKPKIFISRD